VTMSLDNWMGNLPMIRTVRSVQLSQSDRSLYFISMEHFRVPDLGEPAAEMEYRGTIWLEQHNGETGGYNEYHR
jgi:hypothetical protein